MAPWPACHLRGLRVEPLAALPQQRARLRRIRRDLRLQRVQPGEFLLAAQIGMQRHADLLASGGVYKKLYDLQVFA